MVHQSCTVRFAKNQKHTWSDRSSTLLTPCACRLQSEARVKSCQKFANNFVTSTTKVAYIVVWLRPSTERYNQLLMSTPLLCAVRHEDTSWRCSCCLYRAMLCIRGTSHGPVSVCLSVCLSQVGVLLKRLNVYRITQITPHDSQGL